MNEEQESKGTALIPVKERSVEFYGDTINAVLVETGGQEQVYVPLRPICDYLGLSWAGQRDRIMRDPVLSEASRGVRVTRTPAEGGSQEMIALPLEYLPGWLFGVSVSRVREELREKIIRYQRECFRVLWQAFQADTLAIVGSQPAVPTEPSTALVQIRGLALAIAQMAEQQMALEGRVGDAHTRLDRAAEVVGAMQRRLGAVERRITPAASITDEQASEVSMQVKALSEFLTSKEAGKVHYQAIFGELYRRFGVSSYKLIRQEQYQAVLKFLDDWRVAASS
jgi:hypothetical protein